MVRNCCYFASTNVVLLHSFSPLLLWLTCPVSFISFYGEMATGDSGSIFGSRRSPGGRNDYPLQYSCLENTMDRGAWWATVHDVTKSRTRLSLNFPTYSAVLSILGLARKTKSKTLLPLRSWWRRQKYRQLLNNGEEQSLRYRKGIKGENQNLWRLHGENVSFSLKG